MLCHKRISSFTLLLAMCLSTPSANSQTTVEWTPDAMPMGSQIGLLAAFPIVKGRPYTAEIMRQQTTVLTDGTTRLAESHNIQRRDSIGRLLDEQLASPHVKIGNSESFTLHAFVLDDPIKLISVQWHEDSRELIISPIQVPPTCTVKRSGHCPVVSGYSNLQQTDLGERTLVGVVAVGCRTVGVTNGPTPITVTIETWRSEELDIPLLRVEHDSNGGESRLEVTRLETDEPDPNYFRPPQGYRVVTTR